MYSKEKLNKSFTKSDRDLSGPLSQGQREQEFCFCSGKTKAAGCLGDKMGVGGK